MEFRQWLLFAPNQPTDRQQYRLREKVHESHLGGGDGSVLIVDLFLMENKSPFKTIKSSLPRNGDVPDMESRRDRSDALTHQAEDVITSAEGFGSCVNLSKSEKSNRTGSSRRLLVSINAKKEQRLE
ncbi:conserved hypothetical protein [Trichinella spiralis]|uniref:hypothetical protein n=1 Tax=Trichinella spiralis TaxID=6334 RepID=UPI0001EFE3CE|nr:conserved hypothetical protein [Trichinella spiralis]